jgi:hypothetical protein
MGGNWLLSCGERAKQYNQFVQQESYRQLPVSSTVCQLEETLSMKVAFFDACIQEEDSLQGFFDYLLKVAQCDPYMIEFKKSGKPKKMNVQYSSYPTLCITGLSEYLGITSASSVDPAFDLIDVLVPPKFNLGLWVEAGKLKDQAWVDFVEALEAYVHCEHNFNRHIRASYQDISKWCQPGYQIGYLSLGTSVSIAKDNVWITKPSMTAIFYVCYQLDMALKDVLRKEASHTSSSPSVVVVRSDDRSKRVNVTQSNWGRNFGQRGQDIKASLDIAIRGLRRALLPGSDDAVSNEAV